MKHTYYIASYAMLCLLLSCGGHDEKNELAHDHSHDGAAVEAQSHDSDEIFLEPHDAERFGVTTATVRKQPFNNVVKVSGQILNASGDDAVISAPTPGILHLSPNINVGSEISRGAVIGKISSQGMSGGDPNAAARSALNAAKLELDRLTPLLADGIVTRREYNSAVAAYELAKAAYSGNAASGNVTAPISGRITDIFVKSGSFVDAGTPIAAVGKNSMLTLRADMPEKYRHLLPSISGANIRGAYSDSWLSIDSLEGKRVGPINGAGNVKSGYIPVYFTFRNNGNMSAGAFVEVCLTGTGESDRIIVPQSALSEQQGQYFVYIKINEHGYEKRPVIPGGSDGFNTELKSGVNEGESVVVTGTPMVKLAESSGIVPEGHSHNH